MGLSGWRFFLIVLGYRSEWWDDRSPVMICRHPWSGLTGRTRTARFGKAGGACRVTGFRPHGPARSPQGSQGSECAQAEAVMVLAMAVAASPQ